MGLVGAGSYEYEKDYVFATVETLNRDTHLFQYQPNDFDCIILDEAHHSSNNIYTKVIHYFKPKLFLGMTATPDKREDNQEGKNIYEISKDKIFQSIDKIKGMKTLIKESYVSLKNRLGRVPLLYDFYENQEIDPLVIIREYKTYDAFMVAMEQDKYKNVLNEQEKLTLEYLSKTVLSGVRPDELVILRQLLHRDHIEVEDIIKVGIARYKEKYLPGIKSEDPFVLYEKYSRRDVSLLMNCGKDLSSIMYGMKRIENDVFIFITYHKEESQDEKNYVDGKPDYADAFEDNLIFKWDSQIGKGLDSSYMKDVLGADRKHLFVKKSDAETSFYYMGQFDVLEARNAQKEDNRGRMQPITKVTMKMHHAVREDLLRYLQSHITA